VTGHDASAVLTERERTPAAVRERIVERAREIQRRELATATSRLEAQGEFETAQRAAVERMAARIVDGLLGPPLETLETDDRALAAAMELFEEASAAATPTEE